MATDGQILKKIQAKYKFVKKIVNAKKSRIVHVTARDIRQGDRQQNATCFTARAHQREYGFKTLVTRSRLYSIEGEVAVCYTLSPALKIELKSWDRGGNASVGDYIIGPFHKVAKKETQTNKIIKLLREGGNKGVNREILIHKHRMTQAAARISELQSMGYKIESRYAKPCDDHSTFYLVREPKPAEIKPLKTAKADYKKRPYVYTPNIRESWA